ncbi:unnamed protein product [Darwinula stevensoni]|uniref:Fibronectin type-III domain-containing protein n=1 Tax=Darwinula stevensoni TaxID=69355 RepID=A0A7R8XDA5_9CRUS|nr:unnamed protein product [Darwinula stevensoni]CAG0888438.1 unnamed protein product [Darwinula stevensoni]
MTIPSQAYTSTSASVQILRQPPPFPPDWCQLVDPSLPQPQVSAFISGSGVKVQWTVAPGVNLSTVASYEIFSYHEAINDPGPSPWTRLGDVTSLILPMSVTLEKMLKGKTYHFIVRAMNALRQPGPLSKAATLTVP